MTRDTLFIVRGERFDSKAALERRIKEEVGRLPCNAVVVNPFLQAVVNNYHPSFIDAGVCSSGEFSYLDYGEQVRRGLHTATTYRGGRLMTTRVLPLDEWHDCTVYPWRRGDDPRQSIIRALRQKAAFFLPHPKPSERCAGLGCLRRGGDLEYNHINPTFKDIAAECLDLMTDEEITSLFGYNKFTPGKDHLVNCIPDTHPAIVRLHELHVGNEWEWVCAFHHRGVVPVERPTAQAVLDL